MVQKVNRRKPAPREKWTQDERDAKKLFHAHVEQAAVLARQIAEDAVRSETERADAAEAAEILRMLVLEGKLRAGREPKPEVVKRSLWKWLTGS